MITVPFKKRNPRRVRNVRKGLAATLLFSLGLSMTAHPLLMANAEEQTRGSVAVEHIEVDRNGLKIQDIKALEQIANNVSVGEPYQTNPLNLSDYDDYVMYKTPRVANGEVVRGDTVVSYAYIRPENIQGLEGSVVTKYVNEDGVEIAERNITTNKLGQPYQTIEKEIVGYDFQRVIGQPTGTYESGTTFVTYVYSEDLDEIKSIDQEPVSTGTVIVKYIDKDEDQAVNEIAMRQQLTGSVGDEYHTNRKDIAGYRFVETHGDSVGVYTEGVTLIEYVYEKEDAEIEPKAFGTLSVSYVEQVPSQSKQADDQDVEYIPIATSDEFIGEIGTVYEVDSKAVSNYTLIGTMGDSNGKFIDGKTEVVYVYEKVEDNQDALQGTVIVTYRDLDGNEIAPSETMTGDVNRAYTTKNKEIDGYEIRSVVGEPTGVYSEGETHVSYVYERMAVEPVNSVEPNGELTEVPYEPLDDVAIDDSLEEAKEESKTDNLKAPQEPQDNASDSKSESQEEDVAIDDSLEEIKDVNQESEQESAQIDDNIENEVSNEPSDEDAMIDDSMEELKETADKTVTPTIPGDTISDSDVNTDLDDETPVELPVLKSGDGISDSESELSPNNKLTEIPQAGTKTNYVSIGLGVLCMALAAFIAFRRDESVE